MIPQNAADCNASPLEKRSRRTRAAPQPPQRRAVFLLGQGSQPPAPQGLHHPDGDLALPEQFPLRFGVLKGP
jgi:hypothetical protein